MHFKLYVIWTLLFLVFVCQEDQVNGYQEERETTEGLAVQHRRIGRSIFLIKTAIVSGVIGFIAGVVVGKKKAYKKQASYQNEYHLSTNYDHFAKRSIGIEADSDHGALLRTAAVLDSLGCGGRLLCELYQKKPSDLDSIGRKLVQQFNVKHAPTVERIKTDDKAVFQYAAFVGANSPKDLKACSRVFDRCPLNAQAVIKALEDADEFAAHQRKPLKQKEKNN